MNIRHTCLVHALFVGESDSTGATGICSFRIGISVATWIYRPPQSQVDGGNLLEDLFFAWLDSTLSGQIRCLSEGAQGPGFRARR